MFNMQSIKNKSPIELLYRTLAFGGGGGIRTRVLPALTTKDYTFRSMLVLNIPKYVIEFLHPPSPIDVRPDFWFSRFSTFVKTSVSRLYVPRPISLLRLTLQLLLQYVEDLQPEVLRKCRLLKKALPQIKVIDNISLRAPYDYLRQSIPVTPIFSKNYCF